MNLKESNLKSGTKKVLSPMSTLMNGHCSNRSSNLLTAGSFAVCRRIELSGSAGTVPIPTRN